MLDPKNCINLTAGIVLPPETIPMNNGGKIVKLRVAVPYAGQEKDTDDDRGFFDVTFYAREAESNGKFVLNQLEAGNFKPGTTIQLIGRMTQERWVGPDGKKNSKVVVVAENITYAGTNPNKAKADEAEVEEAAGLPDKF